MAAVNSVQNGLRLPITGIASPRLVMCSATMGAEGSVTLELREGVEAPHSNEQSNTAALTIGYSGSDLNDSIKAAVAGDAANFNIIDNKDHNISGAFVNNETLQLAVASVENGSAKSDSNSNSIQAKTLSGIVTVTPTTVPSSSINSSQCPQSTNTHTAPNDCTAVSSLPNGKKPKQKPSEPIKHGPQPCQICNKVFGNASALAKHKLTHSDERKYVCGMCSKAFKRQDHLNGHMLTHRNKKPYECKTLGCSKSYCDARSLRRHVENHHRSTNKGKNSSKVAASNISNGTSLNGASLSPATASGDASSPHGSNCLQFNGNGVGIGDKSSLYSLSIPTSSELTRQQFEHLNRIPLDTTPNITITATTKQPDSKKLQQRPRTWNMQQKMNAEIESTRSTTSPPSTPPMPSILSATLSAPSTAIVDSATSNCSTKSVSKAITSKPNTTKAKSPKPLTSNNCKNDLKPVECNICHRRFKNTPALNGHMRLHGGYFKKDSESKKASEKKDTSGKPLQTASVGVRALIGEKIIQKRGKDLKNSQNAKNAPGAQDIQNGQITQTIHCAQIAQNLSNIQNSMNIQAVQNLANVQNLQNAHCLQNLQHNVQQTIQSIQNSFAVPAAPVRRLAESDIFNVTKTLPATNANTIHVSTTSSVGINQTTNPPHSVQAAQINLAINNLKNHNDFLKINDNNNNANHNNNNHTTVNFSNHNHRSINTNPPPLAPKMESKDATLIELLNRGTKVELKCGSTISANNTPLTFGPTTLPTSTVLLSSNVSAPVTPTTTPPLSISLAGNNTNMKSAPRALTIAQNANGSNDVYTLAYSTDSSAEYLSDGDVYNVLQAVDSIQLLPNSGTTTNLGDLSSIGEFALADTTGMNDTSLLSHYTPSRQLQAMLDSPLPESVAEFTALHSKDFLMYGKAHTAHLGGSPISSSPISYPTPPASHEGITQSPFLDDSHTFGEANSFFKDIKDCEQILKLKNELFNDARVVMNDHLFADKTMYDTKLPINISQNQNAANNIDDFNQNLSFLDASQNFLDDAQNTSSPLSAAFFSGTMSSAEEVKEALQEILPDETINCEAGHDMDLYYSPSLAFQSQMMLNSNDPLLSSSPKDFVSKHQNHRFDFNQNYTINAKKIKLEVDTDSKDGTDDANNETKPIVIQASAGIETDQFLNTAATPIASNDIKPSSAEILSIANSVEATESTSSVAMPCTISPASIITSTSTSTSPPDDDDDNKQSIQLFIRTRKIEMDSAKKAPYGIYKTNFDPKLKQIVYTPSPVLDPNRDSSGTFTEVLNILKEAELQSPTPTFKSIIAMDSEDSDSGVGMVEFLTKSKLNIGISFQADCPKLLKREATDIEVHKDDVHMWSPYKVNNERQVQRFVELAKSSAAPLGCHSEETALRLLQSVNGDFHKAILRMLQETPTSLHNRWKPHEVEIFLNGLEVHGKNFSKIAKDIRSKTTGECVQFYYFWKKIRIDPRRTHLNKTNLKSIDDDANSTITTTTSLSSGQQESRIYVCDRPNCSASFNSKAALQGHTRIHCRAISMSGSPVGQNMSGTSIAITKDDFPCKVCGKLFNKVKSRSAHMKMHRVQELDPTIN